MNNLSRVLFTVFLLVGGLLAGACSNAKVADVVVVDESGNPISGATIEPVSMSINYPKVMTYESGDAWIGEKVQNVKWLKVSKKGYESAKVDFKGPKPVRVVLEKEHVRIDFGKPE